QDAPRFGFDVSAQKARTAVFFSLANADSQLRTAADANIQTINNALGGALNGLNINQYAVAAQNFGVPLNSTIAFTDRAIGFLSAPLFPPGISNTMNAPFSRPINVWSPFNTGLQLALDKPALVSLLATGMTPSALTGLPTIGCSPLSNDLTLA